MNLKSTYQDQKNCSYLLDIEIPATELDNHFFNLVRKYSSSLNLPGFRKGKIPPSIVEKKFGEELCHAVLEEIVPKAIEQTIKEHALETIGPAELEKDHPVLKYEREKSLKMRLILNKKPACTIKSYDNLEIKKIIYKIIDKDIESNRQRILDSLGKSVEIEEAPQLGDMVHLDLTFADEGLKGLNLKNHIALFEEEGKDVHPPYLAPLYDRIKTMKKGDSREITLTFPKDTQEPKLQGKEINLSLMINRVSRFQPAELSQEVLDRLQVKNEAEFMDKIKKDMEDYAKDQAQKNSFEEAVQALKKNTVFEIPEIAVDYYLQSSWNQLAEELKMRGQKNIPENPPEAWTNEHREQTRKRIESDLVITQVKESENIEVGEEELESKIKELAEASKMDLKEYRKQLIRSGGFTELKRQLGQRKTLEWILGKCKIAEEKEVPYQELNQQR